MLPQMRQIHKLDDDGESGGQSTHCEDDVEEKGIGIVEREVLADVGWEDRSVWEYRQTGHLCMLLQR